MKKAMKTFCLLLAFCFLFAAGGTAETQSRGIEAEIDTEGGEIRLRTSLAPGTSATLPLPDGATPEDVFALIRPDALPKLADSLAGALAACAEQAGAETQRGFFTGDLFEQAGEKRDLDLNRAESEKLLEAWAGRIQEQGTDPKTAERAARFLRQAIAQTFGDETNLHISQFDGGRYLSCEIRDGEKPVLTLSADLSESNSCHAVIGRASGQTAWYEEILCRRNGQETEWILCLYRTEEPAFRMVKEQDCVQFSEIRFSEEGEGIRRFEGELHSTALPAAVRFTGSVNTREGSVRAELTADGEGGETAAALIVLINSLLQP